MSKHSQNTTQMSRDQTKAVSCKQFTDTDIENFSQGLVKIFTNFLFLAHYRWNHSATRAEIDLVNRRSFLGIKTSSLVEFLAFTEKVNVV